MAFQRLLGMFDLFWRAVLECAHETRCKPTIQRRWLSADPSWSPIDGGFRSSCWCRSLVFPSVFYSISNLFRCFITVDMLKTLRNPNAHHWIFMSKIFTKKKNKINWRVYSVINYSRWWWWGAAIHKDRWPFIHFFLCVCCGLFLMRAIYMHIQHLYTHHYIYMNCYVCVDAICVL